MRKVDPRDRLTSAHQQMTDINWELVENYSDALFLYRVAMKSMFDMDMACKLYTTD
jgi:hypothetical protein